jgi:hypothetical protein
MRGKKKKICRNLPTLLYRQNLSNKNKKYLMTLKLNKKNLVILKKKSMYTTTKRGQVHTKNRLTCRPRIYRWRTLRQPSSRQFSCKSEKMTFYFDVLYKQEWSSLRNNFRVILRFGPISYNQRLPVGKKSFMFYKLLTFFLNPPEKFPNTTSSL